MKKGFLYTFVTVMIFGVFLVGNINTAYAITRTVKSTVPNNWTTPAGKKIEGWKTTFDDGTYIISYRDEGSTGAYNADYWKSDGKTQINTNGAGRVTRPEDAIPLYASMNQDATRTEAEKKAAAEGHDDNFVTNALQTLVLQIMISGSSLVSWLVGFIGILFDKVIALTTSSDFLDSRSDAGIGKAIEDSWKIIRDFSNIILVFSLLYLGIKTILEGNGFADKKILTGIIIAAITINFSLFFVKEVAFNISNTIGQQILQQANLSRDKSKSISEGLMTIVSPQRVLDMNQFGSSWTAGNIAVNDRTGWSLIFRMVGQMLMFTFVVVGMAVVFLGASLILLYRFFIFIILMIFSPIGLISSQIPWLQKMGMDWWDQLKKQTLFFPAFSLVLYIILLIVTTLALGNRSSLDLNVGGEIFVFLFNFILIIGFMFGLLLLPGKLGAAGAGFMTNAGGYIKNKVKNIPRSAGGLAASGVARTGRQLGGRLIGGGLTGDNKAANKLREVAQGSGLRASLARQTLRSAEGLKNSTFDVRNTKAGAKLGMGKGISNWADAVNSRKQKLEADKKKEFELFGYNKMAKTPENKADIAEAEGKRDKAGEALSSKKIELKAAQARGASLSEIKALTDNISQLEKDLEKEEKAVGALKNKGDSEYLKLLQRRQKRWTIKGKLNTVDRLAIEKLEKEMQKKWQEEGKYTETKKKKNKNSTSSTPTPQPSRATNYVSLPPNLPPPTGL